MHCIFRCAVRYSMQGDHMKKTTSLFVLLIISLIVISCASVPVNLEGVNTEDVEISISRGVTIISTSLDELDIAASGGKIDEAEANVLVSIANNSTIPYNFNESDVKIYYGDISTNSWKLLETWSAKDYYAKEFQKFKSRQFWTAFAGALNVVNASLGSYSTSTVYSGGRYTTVTTYSHNYSDVLMAGMIADYENASVKREGEAYLKYIENNLLYSSTILPGADYIGWLIFKDMGKKGLDYRVDFTNTNTGKTVSLYFTRSDKQLLKK